MTTILIASVLALTNRFGAVSVDTLGARVLSYVPAGSAETLALLASGAGGIPLCWPWFQYNGPDGERSPKHGLARYREFAVVERTNGPETGKIVLRLRSDDGTRRLWPHDFVLTMTVTLDGRGLVLDLTDENTGHEPFSVTEAFHPYLRRGSVRGLADSGSGDYRTWDPDEQSHLKTQGLAPEDWKKFICVENGVFAKDRAYVLKPGERHALTRTLAPDAKSSLLHDAEWMPRYRVLTSTADGTRQPFYWYDPPRTEAVPLVVSLHSWSANCQWSNPARTVCGYCKEHGWAMVYPDFRGPNMRPEACGSELARRDILDVIAWARSARPIDPDRIYIIGGSGGGHMTLLMAGCHPEVFAGAAAFCPITDLARWQADSTLRKNNYARNLLSACGGRPSERPDEYARRSPLTHLARARAAQLPVYVATGIHDGHTGSVPVGHAIRAYNALANDEDVVSEAVISHIEADQAVPAAYAFAGKDPFYGDKERIHLRRTSANVRLTVFEGGHSGNYPAGLDFLSRQRRGRPADMTLPAETTGTSIESVTR